MKPSTIRIIMIALLYLPGSGALGGGAALSISPSGQMIDRVPVSILKNSPFHDFQIPGIILFVVPGVAPVLISSALIKKPTSLIADRFNLFKDMHWSWSISIYTAFALIIWIQTETVMLSAGHWLQTFYTALAVVVLFVALQPKVRGFYKK